MRLLLATIDNAEAVEAPQAVDYSYPGFGRTEAPRRRLGGPDVLGLLDAEIRDRRYVAGQLRSVDRAPDAAVLDAECEVFVRYVEFLRRPGSLPSVEDLSDRR